MRDLLRLDNPVMRALGKIFDVGWLSLLYIIFCIPIITIGPATTALYYTAIKVLRKDNGYVRAEFWHCFKANFKRGAALGVGSTLIYALMLFNINVVMSQQSSYSSVLHVLYMAAMLITTLFLCYCYPILSRFDMKCTQILRLALYMMMRHFITTIILFVIVAASVLGMYYGTIVGLPIVLVVIPGAMSMLYTLPMEYVLRQYMPKDQKKYNEEGQEIKEWYDE